MLYSLFFIPFSFFHSFFFLHFLLIQFFFSISFLHILMSYIKLTLQYSQAYYLMQKLLYIYMYVCTMQL